MKHHRVLRIAAKLLIPFIMLFGLYVQFHGDFGPGGGFQAGVIFAAAIILYALIFGLVNARKVAPTRIVTILISAGVLLFAGVGVVPMFLGANYLDYTPLGATQQSGQHTGILLVEFGVGITVAATMIAIFFQFAGRGRGE